MAEHPEGTDHLDERATKRNERDKKEKKQKKHRFEDASPEQLAALRAGMMAGSDDDDDSDVHDFDADSEESGDERDGAGFLDMAASEGSDDDDEPDEAARLREAEESRYITEHKSRAHFFTAEDENAEAEDIAKRLKEKYKQQAEMEHTEGAAAQQYNSAQRFSAALLPRPTDPKVFAVKVRPGFARILVSRIVNKCQAYLRGENHEGVRQDLGIISAFAVDHVKEWIYLEAHRKRFVETAITGLEHVFRFKITQVDPKDLMQLLVRQVAQHDEVEVGQYVRIKSGPYQEDIALVEEVKEEGTRAVIRLVPREDFIQKAQRPKAVKGNRLPQKLFVPPLATGSRQHANGEWMWDGLRFNADGYLIKEIPARNLLVGKRCQPPRLHELVTFHNNNPEAVEEAMAAIGAAPQNKEFRPDEPVRVSGGQLAGVIGRVRDTDAVVGRTRLETKVKGESSVITVNTSELRKYFAEGTHVVVEQGPHAGESGTVLACQSNMVVLMTDSTLVELAVDSEHLRASKMRSIRPHAAGGHQLYDLVSLSDDKTVGCIAGFTGNHAIIVTPQNTFERTLTQNIKQTVSGKMSVTDSFGNRVTKKDTVTVNTRGVPPQYAGLSATVQQVFHDTLFLLSSSVRENAGAFALNAKLVIRAEGRTKARQQSAFATERTRERDAHPAKAGPSGRITALQSVAGSAATITFDAEDLR